MSEAAANQPSEIQTKFHGKAQAYDRARPGYPEAAMRYIASLLPDGARVADIGAGTGKFTVPLAKLEYEIAAVEPDADMRGVLTDATRPYANVTAADGTAEHTGLPDHSVDAITCAQALHWFDRDAFLAECARISRSDTFLLISIYNSTSFDSAMMRGVDRGVPGPAADADGGVTGADAAGAAALSPADLDGDDAAAGSVDVANIASVTRTAGTLAVSAGDVADIGVSARHFRETAAAFFTHPTIRRFPNPIRYTRETWRTYMDSHSHSPLPTDPAYPAHRAWVDAIFDARAVDGVLTDDNVTMIASELLPAIPAGGKDAVTMRAYDVMPAAARDIRERVFVREREWRPEFDGWDEAGRATHLLAFDGGRAVGTCRFYKDPDHAEDQPGRYVIARLAVLPGARGRHIGSMLLSEAERRIALAGGTVAAVHAENDYYAFYEQRGYRLTDDVYEGGRHGWLAKRLD